MLGQQDVVLVQLVVQVCGDVGREEIVMIVRDKSVLMYYCNYY